MGEQSSAGYPVAINNAIHGFEEISEERKSFCFPNEPKQYPDVDSSGMNSSLHCGPLKIRSFLNPNDSDFCSSSGTNSCNPNLVQPISPSASNKGQNVDNHDIRPTSDSKVKYTAQTILSAAGISVEDKIGKGSFSHVYKATSPNGPVAVKVMLYKSTKPVSLDEAEVAVLQSLRHQNIVQLIDVFCGATTCIVLEFCAGGDLYTVLHKPPVPLQLSVKQHLSMVRGIGEAIQFLHSQNIIHRDVKSSNCLLAEALTNASESPVVKLADFGFAKVMQSQMTSQKKMTKCIGSSRWMAPEVYAGDNYDSSADVYSFGVFMYEVFSHELPYGKQALEPRFGLLISFGKRPQMNKLPDWCAQELRELIESCWETNPSERPTMMTVVQVIDQVMQQ